ncbi:hypothetical protein BJY24_003728 [Nocardia transvalensis]|uniref:Uncharacterized protein n=1 Tax=Nocardia transvalensis TaxID=37333 RepID=A0A7W9PEU1_9NOCA|nr:hypothetical protein [Nocardia transvalensis]MBB5914861.1 hypothetical protein [Nocardia transvalensis]
MTLREKVGIPVADPSPIYGTPHETADGSTVITVSTSGGLLRPGPRPLGIFVLRGDEVTWKPATDDGRVALIAVVTGLVAATFATLAMVRRPPWPDMTITQTQ